MTRIQILFTEKQTEKLKELAHAGNMSMSEVVRKALDHFITEQQLVIRPVCHDPYSPPGKHGAYVIGVTHDPDDYVDEFMT